VVTQGADGSTWRLTSDEGKHLRGTDLAPFPLGFFNAGMQSDLYGRVRAVAATRNVALDHVEIRVANHYWFTGSFIHGTGEGHAEAPDIDVRVKSGPSTGTTEALITAAMDASPAIAFLRTSLSGNTFALYVNGRRRKVEGVAVRHQRPHARTIATAVKYFASRNVEYIIHTGRPVVTTRGGFEDELVKRIEEVTGLPATAIGGLASIWEDRERSKGLGCVRRLYGGGH
jgi:hypothetical protein